MTKKILLAVFLSFFICSSSYAGTLIGTIKVRRLRDKSNIVICLQPLSNIKVNMPSKNPVVDQRKLEFIPPVLVITLGSTVDFANNDKTKHNIFSPDKIAHDLNFGDYDRGEVKKYTFNTPGSVALLCNKHDEMEGYIYICESHLKTITDRDGNYKIENIPPGKYLIKFWHKSLKPYFKEIIIDNGVKTITTKLRLG